MYPCIERTLEITHRKTTVRLWINCLQVKDKPKNIEQIIQYIKLLIEEETLEEFLIKKIIKKIENINAVQIISENEIYGKGIRDGLMVYTVPF